MPTTASLHAPLIARTVALNGPPTTLAWSPVGYTWQHDPANPMPLADRVREWEAVIERADHMIRAVEDRLREIGIPVGYHVLTEASATRPEWGLSFGPQTGDGMRFSVGPCDGPPVPWSEVPADVRLAAPPALAAMLAEATAAMEAGFALIPGMEAPIRVICLATTPR